MINLFHSYWSAPKGIRFGFDKQNDYAELLCAAISLLLAKRNGCKVDFYGDGPAVERFGFLPYDGINYLNFDADTKFWAAGKIAAQAAAPIGAVQIDIDVFLNGAKCYELLEYAQKRFDLVVQNQDVEYTQSNIYGTRINAIRQLIPAGVAEVPFFDINGKVYAYGCGLVGFNSQELKDLYCFSYEKVSTVMEESPHFDMLDKSICLDLVAEQALLYMCASEAGASVFSMLPDNSDVENITSDSRIGYLHQSYTSKYNDKIIAKNEKFLYLLSPEIYKKLLERK